MNPMMGMMGGMSPMMGMMNPMMGMQLACTARPWWRLIHAQSPSRRLFRMNPMGMAMGAMGMAAMMAGNKGCQDVSGKPAAHQLSTVASS